MILYRRNLLNYFKSDKNSIFSYQLAELMGITPAQVRRDLMVIGYSGSPAKGYDIRSLIKSIGQFIDAETRQSVALVGVGNIGRAIIDYFKGRREKLDITALFDIDPNKINRSLYDCPCFHIDQLEEVIQKQHIRVGIITVPDKSAQEVAEHLVHAGITGILNYAPVKLELSQDIYIENRDMIMAIEKVAYFARNHGN
ncbi:redox-sensing transcriptional repressor Rex [bacterium]